ncbi:hypothetical protein [Arhodomonas sp. AD133]|uniref:hypothetical protein n=1 Tax=Arhodomonas sp. AD133 TaxID=3415009 RepID=UPI003EB906CE
MLKGFVAGAVLAGIIGFALGYNHGRGAPWHANPFAEYTLGDRFSDEANRMIDDLQRELEQERP